MKNDVTNKKDTTVDELIVIPDECGDSMWDAVLGQQINSCDVKTVSYNPSSLLNKINAVQECDLPTGGQAPIQLNRK